MNLKKLNKNRILYTQKKSQKVYMIFLPSQTLKEHDFSGTLPSENKQRKLNLKIS
jgi:hypothetical protein